MEKINLEEKFSLFNEHWSPKVLGDLNGRQVKIAKVKEIGCTVFSISMRSSA